MKTILAKSFTSALLLAGLLPGCGGAAGEALRPTDHTANNALTAGNGAPTCAGNAKYAKPLIVDLDADARVDLEASMKKGLVIVSYDCANVRVLTSCKLPEARYEYAGVQRKEQVVQIKNADDLSVNLPLSSAKLSGELTSGRTIDLALVLVGQRSTTVDTVERADLKGSCEGATHYLQNASLGAFSMQTGSVGKVAAVAEMFGRGGSASSKSERKSMSSDGSLDDCRTSNPDAENPPAECRAPLRIELVPIAEKLVAEASSKGEKKETKKTAEAQENPCPTGYNLVEGLCSKAADKARLCDPKNESECKEQCDKGSPESCFNYGRLLTKRSPRTASIPAFKKACEADLADGCASWGWELAPVDDEDPAFEANAKEAIKILAKSCTMGSAMGCDYAGDVYTDKSYKVLDNTAGVRAFDRGCSLGSGSACSSLSRLYFRGELVEKNPVKAVSFLIKACQGKNPDECAELGIIFTKGQGGIAPDAPSAIRAYDRACDMDIDYCYQAAQSALNFDDNNQAFKFANRGCDNKDEEACEILGNLHNEGKGTQKDEAKAKEAWTKACNAGEGNTNACKRIGVRVKN